MQKPAWAPAFESFASPILDAYQCPGLAVGVAHEGTPVYFHSFGHRDREQQLPFTPDTVAGIASCTKSFTCLAIMQLQEAGKLSVYDPVVQHLPEFTVGDAAVTRAINIHHLMTHTSGLPPLPTLFHAMLRSMKPDLPAEGNWDAFEEINSYDELMAFLARNPELLGPPGTKFSYSNDGYALLGHIVERVSGQRLEAYMREHIWGPAGMHRTTFDTRRAAEMGDVAVLYNARPKEGSTDETEVVLSPRFWEPGVLEAAGAIRSTVADMLRYAEIYRTGGMVHGVRILSRESVEMMMHPHVEVDAGVFYGYGLQVVPEYQGVSLVEHGGSLKGVSSNFTVVPGRGLTGVVLNNLSGVPAARVLLGALNAAMGIPVETERIQRGTFEYSPEQLKVFEGTYPLTEGLGGEMSFRVEDGVLKVKSVGGISPLKETPLAPVGRNLFELKIKESKMYVRFLFNAYGEVYAVFWGLRMLRKGSPGAAQ